MTPSHVGLGSPRETRSHTVVVPILETPEAFESGPQHNVFNVVFDPRVQVQMEEQFLSGDVPCKNNQTKQNGLLSCTDPYR